MNNGLIASALANTRIKYFVDIVKGFMDEDISSVAVYLVDICSAEALPLLADQFGVGGKNGFDYCTTETQQRALIKNAIPIQKYMGTAYAIRKICESLGFTFKRIDTGINGIWCAFNVILSGTATDTTNLQYLINRYKSARDILVNINFES